MILIVVDPQDLVDRKRENARKVGELRREAAAAIADRQHAGHARDGLDRSFEPAALERRAEGEMIGEEKTDLRATCSRLQQRFNEPFHTDPAAGAASVFGRHIGSGWHTAAITMRLWVDHGPMVAGGTVGLGVDDLRWGPLVPGDRLRLEGEVDGRALRDAIAALRAR